MKFMEKLRRFKAGPMCTLRLLYTQHLDDLTEKTEVAVAFFLINEYIKY